MFTLTIKDSSFSGNIIHQQEIAFPSREVTIRDIITARVHKEVARYNNSRNEVYTFIQPTFKETLLNQQKRLGQRPKIDAEKQVYVALDGFQKNGFFVLVNERQVESLDEQVALDPTPDIQFLRLMPLVGG